MQLIVSTPMEGHQAIRLGELSRLLRRCNRGGEMRFLPEATSMAKVPSGRRWVLPSNPEKERFLKRFGDEIPLRDTYILNSSTRWGEGNYCSYMNYVKQRAPGYRDNDAHLCESP